MKTRLLSLAACAFLTVALLRADDWSPNFTTTTTWNDNVTNADRSADKIGALEVNGDAVAYGHYKFGRDDTAKVGFHAAVDWWPRYQLLLTGAIGARAGWEHKFGLGALAPVLSLELAGDIVDAKEKGRRGTSVGGTLSLSKRFNDRWRASLTQDYSQMYARYSVWDSQANQTTAEVAFDLSDVSRLTVAGFYRSGDIVSYATPPRPDIVALAPNRLSVDTFRHPLTAYSVDANTVGGKISYLYALDQTSAVVGAYECRQTEKSPLRYVNQLVSVALVHQF